MSELSIDRLSCGYGSHLVLDGISFSLQTGETLCLLGSNGAGKTTLFKTMLGLLKPLGGAMRFNGEDVAAWPRKHLAQMIAYIPQDHVPAFPFTAFEVVLMGRTPHTGTLSSVSAHDEEVAHEAMLSLGIGHLAKRDYTQISGGERQMVLIARALAQQPAFLAMDEPTASLDFGNQARVLSRIRSLARGSKAKLGVILTTHDPNQAFLLGHKVACIARDGSFIVGEAADVLTPQRLSSLYDVQVGFAELTDPDGRKLSVCTPFLEDGC